MIEKKPQLKETLKTVQGHIFYTFQDLDKYIDNVIAYTVSGIEQGSHVLLIENTKMLPVIQQKLKAVLSKEQLSNVHFKNNFDFYFSQRTFNPVVVFNHLVKSLEDHISIRTYRVGQYARGSKRNNSIRKQCK